MKKYDYLGMVQRLGPDVPFVMIAASKVFSLSVSNGGPDPSVPPEYGVRIKEETEIICEEVVEIQIDRSLTGVS